mgnify:FL=1
MTSSSHGTTTSFRLPSRRVFTAFLGLAVLLGVACKREDITGGIRPGTIFVAARDTFFTPDTVTIAAGFPVRWTNEGKILHSVVSDSSFWASELLTRNSWFEVTIDSPGTYSYHCSEHGNMTGTVVVTP